MADIKTLEYLIENVKTLPKERINNELDNFKNRFSTIIIQSFLKKQQIIISQLNKILRNDYRVNDLENLYNNLNVILQNYTLKFIKENSISVKIGKIIQKY